MDEIKRYNNLETQTLEGEWVKHSDHEAAIKAAVAAERKAWADAVAQGLPPDIAKAIDEILARGAAHE